MRSLRLRRLASLAIVAGLGAVPSAFGAEVRQRNWSPVTLTYTSNSLVAGWTSTAEFASYMIWRADTATFPLSGGTLRGNRRPGIALRTSAGATTRAEVSGDGTGRHLLVVRGRGFLPQVISCCRRNGKDYPVETSGRDTGPITLAAALDGKLVRSVVSEPGGTYQLRARHIDDAPGEPLGLLTSRALDIKPLNGRITIAPSLLAWVDERAPDQIRTATIAPGSFDPVAAQAIPVTGEVRQLQATPTTIVALILADGRYRLMRYDAPDRLPTQVWVGSRPPGPVAVGGDAVVFAVGAGLRQHIPGETTRAIRRLRVAPSAIATDGTRVAAAERIALRGTRFTVFTSSRLLDPLEPPT